MDGMQHLPLRKRIQTMVDTMCKLINDTRRPSTSCISGSNLPALSLARLLSHSRFVRPSRTKGLFLGVLPVNATLATERFVPPMQLNEAHVQMMVAYSKDMWNIA